jgi:putative ABC transport system permease protein
VNDNNEEFQRYQNVILGDPAFVWIVGIGTILAGCGRRQQHHDDHGPRADCVDRVRKALGATPGRRRAVLQESILITSVAGYIGLVTAIAVLRSRQEHPCRERVLPPIPEVSLVAIEATLLLIVAGWPRASCRRGAPRRCAR